MIEPYMIVHDWPNRFYNIYMVAIVNIISKRGLRIEACHRNQPNMSKLLLYKLFLLLQLL